MKNCILEQLEAAWYKKEGFSVANFAVLEPYFTCKRLLAVIKLNQEKMDANYGKDLKIQTHK